MKPLSSLKKLRKAQRLYNELIRGEIALLVVDFPFVKLAFTPQIAEPTKPPEIPQEAPLQAPPVALPAPEPPPKKPIPPPKISFRARSEEDDLRDALDIGFGTLTFDAIEDREKQSRR
jgi:hypothetical protein